MKLRSRGLAVVLLFLGACATPGVETLVAEMETPGTSSLQPYGVDGTLTVEDVLLMQHLSWPQTYDAMKGSFGFPAFRSEAVDVYKIAGREQSIAVFYDGDQAIGYEVREP